MSELINNSEQRKERLKKIIKSLHEGVSVTEAQIEFRKHFAHVSTQEISAVEQELVKEGMPIEEIQKLCDVHALVYEGSFEEIHGFKDFSKIPGHPCHVFALENKAIAKLINEEIIPRLDAYLAQPNHNDYLHLRIGMDQLATIDRHYGRKEYLFFPFLEKKGITAPPKVMWGVDDEIRLDLKQAIALLSDPQASNDAIEQAIRKATTRVLDMIFKEDNILMPLLAETLHLLDWIRIDEATPEYGYTLIDKPVSWKVQSESEKEDEVMQATGEVNLDAGSLSGEEINAILNTLPLDITFVDVNNEVKYFSSGVKRIFDRPKTIIGRNVSMCHPPQSVHVVEAIINDFKTGKKDYEDFWIRLKEDFIMIRYFAVRNRAGEYLGTLEFSQNIKPITELKGEKRLVSK